MTRTLTLDALVCGGRLSRMRRKVGSVCVSDLTSGWSNPPPYLKIVPVTCIYIVSHSPSLQSTTVRLKDMQRNMSSVAYEPVATTEETSPLPPTRPRKYRVVAVALLLSILILASFKFYKSGNWALPSGVSPISPPTTPSQSDNKTDQIVMPHGKYSVG